MVGQRNGENFMHLHILIHIYHAAHLSGHAHACVSAGILLHLGETGQYILDIHLSGLSGAVHLCLHDIESARLTSLDILLYKINCRLRTPMRVARRPHMLCLRIYEHR